MYWYDIISLMKIMNNKFIILRAFMDKEEVTEIFGENLLNKKELEKHFLELIGKSETKPFECVGTIDKVNYTTKIILIMNF